MTGTKASAARDAAAYIARCRNGGTPPGHGAYHPRIDLTGRRFGRLTVTGYLGPADYGSRTTGLWDCECDCGGECAAKAPLLVGGRTRSCGCLRREHLDALHAARRHHGKENR